MVNFGVLGDVHLGRQWKIVNWWDYFIPHSAQEVVGIETEMRLLRFVERINKSPIPIEFVISVGDITESVTERQVRKVKQIMNLLRVPWIPVEGGHDIWPYERGNDKKVLWNAEKPYYFSDFKKIFSEEFTKAISFFKDWEEQGGNYENLAFVYSDIRFVIVDNVSYQRAPQFPYKLPGAASKPRLHPESLEWLTEQLKKSEERRIVIVSHASLKSKLPEELVKNKEILMIAGHKYRYTYRKKKNIISLTANALYVDPGFPIVTISPEDRIFTIEFQKL